MSGGSKTTGRDILKWICSSEQGRDKDPFRVVEEVNTKVLIIRETKVEREGDGYCGFLLMEMRCFTLYLISSIRTDIPEDRVILSMVFYHPDKDNKLQLMKNQE